MIVKWLKVQDKEKWQVPFKGTPIKITDLLAETYRRKRHEMTYFKF